MISQELLKQLTSLAAALFLLTAFAILAQRHMRALLGWFAIQGVLLAATSALVAFAAASPELYISALLALLLKGFLMPWLLWRVVVRLGANREVETLINIFPTLLIAALLVLFAYYISLPIQKTSVLMTRNIIAIGLACVLIGMLIMITRRKAVTQVVGYLAMENALFFTATAATHGMPLVVEIGIAFDVLIAGLIFGLFFFHIRKTFDSLDLRHLERK
ncbi:MAG: formate hydrogenlyase [Candidatus Nitronauta litoralis]|uniref:Formate hydrogenlyase n=1 Tax=Candidatus Nitronauta litoralis TaxID=2705533 RepID=A0A7T0G0P2_9BACT|nr:MAG: formate hydrogenlyase [Candidatus Nitronauta litoralis]